MRKKLSRSKLLDEDSEDDDMFAGNDGHINKESILLDSRADSQHFYAMNNSHNLQHQPHSQDVSKIEDNKLDITDMTGKDIGEMILEQ